ncbi:unnamed protein product [Heligmosomoides polygyrus]|uniref:DZF domain-containing protein n=1 Tax=Heligmosomoides polygyrus TaxID=6339 RepID=A0A183FA24_HELPZ|nr:unnamed protein product [Heligmosomoides polygyrus]
MEDRREAIADCMLVRAHRVVDDFLREKGDCPPAFRRPLGPVFAIAQQPKVEEKTKRQREGEPQKEDDTYTAIEGACG